MIFLYNNIIKILNVGGGLGREFWVIYEVSFLKKMLFSQFSPLIPYYLFLYLYLSTIHPDVCN